MIKGDRGGNPKGEVYDDTPHTTAKVANSSHAAIGVSVSAHEMHGHSPKGSSDQWLFNAEATSTLLIAAWYIYSVFIALGILPDGGLFAWGSEWIMSFLLGIFYLGAGYLFQRHQHVNSLSQWAAYMRREVVILLTPFLAFTVLVLLTGSLTSLEPALAQAGLASAKPVFTFEALVHAIFVDPVIPVGYFVVLLGFFVITRTPRGKGAMWALIALALAAKVAAVILGDTGIDEAIPYYPMHWLENWIWFVAGIAMSFFGLPSLLARPVTAIVSAVAFVGLGAVLFILDVRESALLALLVVLGLSLIFSVFALRFLDRKQNAFFGLVTRYTMAIWLMHEMLSKIVFCGLFAIGVCPDGAFSEFWVPICAIATLIACYPLPVLIMKILSKVWKLGFIVYPARYLPPAKG